MLLSDLQGDWFSSQPDRSFGSRLIGTASRAGDVSPCWGGDVSCPHTSCLAPPSVRRAVTAGFRHRSGPGGFPPGRAGSVCGGLLPVQVRTRQRLSGLFPLADPVACATVPLTGDGTPSYGGRTSRPGGDSLAGRRSARESTGRAEDTALRSTRSRVDTR